MPKSVPGTKSIWKLFGDTTQLKHVQTSRNCIFTLLYFKSSGFIKRELKV